MRHWYCHINGQNYGPYPEEQMRDMLRAGQIKQDTLVFCAEQTELGWVKTSETEIIKMPIVREELNHVTEESLPPLAVAEPAPQMQSIEQDDADDKESFMDRLRDIHISKGAIIAAVVIIFIILTGTGVFFGYRSLKEAEAQRVAERIRQVAEELRLEDERQEELQRQRENRRIQQEEQEIRNELILKKATLERDMFTYKSEFHQHKVIFDNVFLNHDLYIHGAVLYLSLVETADGRVGIVLRGAFGRSDWLFINEVFFNVDGETGSIKIPIQAIDREVIHNSRIEESFGISTPELTPLLSLLLKIADSTRTAVRFSGDRGNIDFEIARDKKQAFGRMLELYAVYQGLGLLDG